MPNYRENDHFNDHYDTHNRPAGWVYAWETVGVDDPSRGPDDEGRHYERFGPSCTRGEEDGYYLECE